MQFADVSFGLMQILCDGKVPSNELLLHKPCSAQVQAAKCIKMLQIPSNFAHILRSLEIPTHQATKILYADLFSLLVLANHFQPLHLWLLHRGMLTHRDAFAHGCFYTEMLFAETCFQTHTHTNLVLLHTNAFMHRCFFTGMLLFAGAFTHRCAGISTHRCLYTAMLSHRILLHTTVAHVFFTRGFSWHKVAFTHRSFTEILLRDMVPTQEYICTEVFFYTGTFTKRWFLHRYFSLQRDAFTRGCF